MDVDVTLMRIIWLLTAIFTGIGFVAYIIAWIAMPAEPALVMPPGPATKDPEATQNRAMPAPPSSALPQGF